MYVDPIIVTAIGGTISALAAFIGFLIRYLLADKDKQIADKDRQLVKEQADNALLLEKVDKLQDKMLEAVRITGHAVKNRHGENGGER